MTLDILNKVLLEKGYSAQRYPHSLANFPNLIGQNLIGLFTSVQIGNNHFIRSEIINEAKYGFCANMAAKLFVEVFKETRLCGESQPDILHQMVEVFGRGSRYKGPKPAGVNRAIVNQLSRKLVDGVKNHFFYTKYHQGYEDPATSSDINGAEQETRHPY